MKRREALKNTAILGGTAAFSATLLTLFQACKAQPRLSWKPQFLSIEQAQLVTALVDTILPKTDTPGGLDVKVDILIDLLYAKTYDEQGQQNIVAEMDGFNDKCVAKFGKVFYELAAAEKKAILQAEEANSPTFNSGVWGASVGEQKPVGFYRSFKSLAVWGYCSSEEIGKNVLKYDAVPGDYQGCIPLSDIGGVWSL